MYQSGIYQHVWGPNQGAHAIKIIGWGEESGVPYWEIGNSFNTYWGGEGFFRMLRGVNECNIEGYVTGGWP